MFSFISFIFLNQTEVRWIAYMSWKCQINPHYHFQLSKLEPLTVLSDKFELDNRKTGEWQFGGNWEVGGNLPYSKLVRTSSPQWVSNPFFDTTTLKFCTHCSSSLVPFFGSKYYFIIFHLLFLQIYPSIIHAHTT